MPRDVPSIVAKNLYSLTDLRRAFGKKTFERGLDYAARGLVTIVAVSGGSAEARVRGGQHEPYTCSVTIARYSGRFDFSGSCSCPVGYLCKHCAAVFVSLHAGGGPHRTAQEASVSPRVARWLQEVIARDPAPRAYAAGEQRIVYLIEPDASAPAHRRTIPVVPMIVQYAKAGHWNKVRVVSSNALVTAQSKAYVAEDMSVGRLMQRAEWDATDWAGFTDLIIRAALATGRAFAGDVNGSPLRLDGDRLARLSWHAAADGSLRPALTPDEPGAVVLRDDVAWFFDAHAGTLGPLRTDVPASLLAAVLAAPPIAPGEIDAVRDALSGRRSTAALAPSAASEETFELVAPVPNLRLTAFGSLAGYKADRSSEPTEPRRAFAELTFTYGGVEIDPRQSGRVRRLRNGRSIVHPRAVEDETEARAKLRALDLLGDPLADGRASGIALTFDGPTARARWARLLAVDVTRLRADGWHVSVDDDFPYRILDAGDPSDWHAEIEERAHGWFDLAIDIELDGKRRPLLPIVRDAIARGLFDEPQVTNGEGPVFITLDDGSIVAFPAERLRAIVRTLVDLADPASLDPNGRIRLPRTRAVMIGELETATGTRVQAPKALREIGESLRNFEGVARVPVPSTFKGELRPYQRDGVDWLQFLRTYGFGGILADDMGLGKSVQTLAHLLCEKQSRRLRHPALVVVPTSLVFNWLDEAARFAPNLRVLALHGPDRASRFGEIPEHDLVITTYALLVRDAPVAQQTWHVAIFDEAQSMKNPTSKATQTAMALRAGHRILLTGTPVENHLGDLWTLLSLALPGVLGDRRHFARVFRTPIEKHADGDRGRVLAERIRPFVLRRTKERVATELPEKSEFVRRVEFAGAQRDLYESVRVAMHDRVRDEIERVGAARSQIVILDALLKLRQVCCDPRLLPPKLRRTGAPSAKLELLMEMLPTMVEEGRRILVFSQFTSMLDLIAQAADERSLPHVVLTGETRDRASAVKSFQAGDVPIFLISLKAGGFGLNLTAADTVVHFDPWWNPATERQATDRAHRIGQEKHVFVYKLIGAGTVEEKILGLQDRKAKLAAAIFQDAGATDARLTHADIDRLFAPIE